MVPDDGETHQGAFDIALIRSVPNMIMMAPASAREIQLFLEWAVNRKAPVVLRHPKTSCPSEQGAFALPVEEGRGVLLRCHDVVASESASLPDTQAPLLIVCTGGIFSEALATARNLVLHNILVDIYNLRFIKPIDKEAIVKAVMDTRRIITVEDHTVIGGLGSAVAEVVVESGKGCAFKKLGVQDTFAPIGLHEDIMSYLGIDSNGIIEAVREVMKADFEEDNDWDDEF
mgnify:CR=1 FL=1